MVAQFIVLVALGSALLAGVAMMRAGAARGRCGDCDACPDAAHRDPGPLDAGAVLEEALRILAAADPSRRGGR